MHCEGLPVHSYTYFTSETARKVLMKCDIVVYPKNCLANLIFSKKKLVRKI
jgi:hypothetical protein